mmetsp:Transcript_139539/g.389208  ORF Transcript_139539/g.389208 Transcript_139539/m.389208 type:complete len:224 (+) Transcript_139539:290-961(+)
MAAGGAVRCVAKFVVTCERTGAIVCSAEATSGATGAAASEIKSGKSSSTASCLAAFTERLAFFFLAFPSAEHRYISSPTRTIAPKTRRMMAHQGKPTLPETYGGTTGPEEFVSFVTLFVMLLVMFTAAPGNFMEVLPRETSTVSLAVLAVLFIAPMMLSLAAMPSVPPRVLVSLQVFGPETTRPTVSEELTSSSAGWPLSFQQPPGAKPLEKSPDAFHTHCLQ